MQVQFQNKRVLPLRNHSNNQILHHAVAENLI